MRLDGIDWRKQSAAPATSEPRQSWLRRDPARAGQDGPGRARTGIQNAACNALSRVWIVGRVVPVVLDIPSTQRLVALCLERVPAGKMWHSVQGAGQCVHSSIVVGTVIVFAATTDLDRQCAFPVPVPPTKCAAETETHVRDRK